MKLSKHRIFISGGAGVIGKELVKILYHEGAKLFIGDLQQKPKSFKEFEILSSTSEKERTSDIAEINI